MNRSRVTADLASHGNIFVDIANDRVGIGSTIPTHKIDISGTVKLHDHTGHQNHITYSPSGPAPHIHLPTGPLSNLARTPYIGFGDRTSGGDFKIYHDYYNAHLKLSGLGGLYLSNNTGVIGINGANGSGNAKTSISIPAGATEGVKLYHGHPGSLKFETVGYGVTVLGTTETQELNVTGVSTFSGLVNANANVTITNTNPKLSLTDSDANSDYSIHVNAGNFQIKDETNGVNQFRIHSDGTCKITGNLDAESGVDVTGHVTVSQSLTVSGGYVYAAGGLHIENSDPRINLVDTNGNPDYHIRNSGGALVIRNTTNGVNNLVINAGGEAVFGGNGVFSGNLTISNGQPTINLTDTDANSDYKVNVNTGNFYLTDTTNNQTRFYLTSDGGGFFQNNFNVAGDLTLTDTATDSAAGPEFKLFRNSASPADADYLGQIKFAGESDTGVERNYAKITGKILDASNGTEDGIIEFAHIKAGSQTITGRFRSDSLQLLNGTALTVAGNADFSAGVDVTGNITVTGTVDGVDIAALNTTVSNITTDVVSDTSPQLGGNLDLNGNSILLDDDEKIFIGTSNDGSLFNSGSYLFLKNHNGSVAIQASSGGVISLQKYDNSDIGLQYVVDGKIQLNHDNVRALETDTQGINVYGATSSSNGAVDIYPTGSAVYSILNLYNAAGNSNAQLIAVSGTTVYLGSGGSGSVNLRTGNSQNKVTCAHNGAVALYHSSSKKFETSSTGGSLTGVLSVSSNIRVSGEIDLGTTNGNKFMDVCLGDNYGFYLRSTSGEGANHEALARFERNRGAIFYWDANTRFSTTSDGVDFGTGGANDILCISGQTLHRTGGNGCGLHFSSSVILPTNAAGTTGDQTCSLGNGSNRFTSLNVMQLSVYDRVNTDLKPYASSTYDLGSTTYRWRNVYVSGLIQNLFTSASTATQAEFRNEHSVYGGGVRFKSNNTYGTVEIINYNGTASASIYNSTGGWHWTGNWQTHGNVLPFQDNSHTLGTSSKRWSNIYSEELNVEKSSGNLSAYFIASNGLGTLEIGGSTGAFIDLKMPTSDDFDFRLGTGGSGGYMNVPSGQAIAVTGHFNPAANNTYDLGTTSARWRNVYTNDLNLSNEGDTNDVDGTWGSYTIQEGEDDLFLINRRNGKKYKFNLTEVS